MADHFSSPQWVDLVRGLATEDTREAMDRHLHGGCDQCNNAFKAWQGFASFAEADRGFAPPADALRVVRSYLAQQTFDARSEGQARKRAWMPSTLATLVFDSMLGMPAGVRAGAGYSRHLLFSAQSLAIDLHVETASKPGWFLLAGQI